MRADRDTIVRRLALSGVVISATVLSYSTLHHRAVAIGIPEWSAWFYPVLYDAFILAASRTWQNHTLSDSTRNMAKWATLGTIAAALLMFVGEFLPRGPVATLSSLMIPAVMATALVLMSRSAADRKAAAESAVEETPVVDTPLVPPSAPEPVAKQPEPTETPLLTIELPDFEPTDKNEWINAQLDAGVDVTGAMIDKKFGGRNGARTLKKVLEKRASRNGHRMEVTA